ncbi:MAG: thiamine pyrophosphate-binding protein, partial [Terrimesophilobacter sp.]
MPTESKPVPPSAKPDASLLPKKTASPVKEEILTGSGAILRSLEKLGITEVFGLPGGAIMPFYDELMSSTTIRHILVRHEQG